MLSSEATSLVPASAVRAEARPEAPPRKPRIKPARGGETALQAASRAGNASIVHMLLDAGADPATTDSEGNTSLLLAAREGHVDCVKELLAGGADINARDFAGIGALHKSFESHHTDMAYLLYSKGARSCSDRCVKCRLGLKLIHIREAQLREQAQRAKTGKQVSQEEIAARIFAEFGDGDVAAEIARMKLELQGLGIGEERTRAALGGGVGGGSSASGVTALEDGDADALSSDAASDGEDAAAGRPGAPVSAAAKAARGRKKRSRRKGKRQQKTAPQGAPAV